MHTLAERLRGWISGEIDEDSTARRVAEMLRDKMPVIYATPMLATTGRRWATQFNENSKIMAFHGNLPEMNHNEIVGIDGDREDILQRLAFIILDDDINERISLRISFLKDLFDSKGIEYMVIKARGDNPVERAFSTMVIGDAASIFLAETRGVEPEPVDVITRLKDSLK